MTEYRDDDDIDDDIEEVRELDVRDLFLAGLPEHHEPDFHERLEEIIVEDGQDGE